MAHISKRNRRREREAQQAQKNRREIVAAQLSRREMMQMGLLTSAGFLIPIKGLSAHPTTRSGFMLPDNICTSPATSAFTEAFTPMTVKRPETTPLTPTPTIAPNNAAGEGRTRNHQVVTSPFPPTKQYRIVQQAAQTSVHAGLPLQTLWTFDGLSPGPLYIARYGEPIIVRNLNALPADNGGFGINQVSTHLHNGHTPSESDGFPCDYFPNPAVPAIANATFYDQYYPNVLAGFASTHPPNGDINESMSSLWYHDHRVDFTAQNVYKGLEGFLNIFNQFDTGDEGSGFHLPSFPQFDINVILNDKLLDPGTGLICFDTFNFDGVVGDVQLANGKVQPFLNVNQRRYRFRVLVGGPSRFYELFLTNPNNLSQQIPFWVIANDGNLLTHPVQVTSFRIGVAERYDIVIDFKQIAQTFGATV